MLAAIGACNANDTPAVENDVAAMNNYLPWGKNAAARANMHQRIYRPVDRLLHRCVPTYVYMN